MCKTVVYILPLSLRNRRNDVGLHVSIFLVGQDVDDLRMFVVANQFILNLGR